VQDRKIKSKRQKKILIVNHQSSISNSWPRPGLPRSSYGRPDMEERQKQGIIQSTSRSPRRRLRAGGQGGHQSSIPGLDLAHPNPVVNDQPWRSNRGMSKPNACRARAGVNHEGFTLVEVIICIVVAGVITSAIFIPFLTSLKGSMTPEKVATATYLAQQRTEFFTKNSYDSGQLSPTPLTSYISAEISGYQWQWQISYVDEDLANSPSDVGYKLILVRVKDPDNEAVDLQTVVTKRPADE
jgi:prepilin-type N-terminal cleavage/methylation domain-containing protein